MQHVNRKNKLKTKYFLRCKLSRWWVNSSSYYKGEPNLKLNEIFLMFKHAFCELNYDGFLCPL